MSRKRVPLNQNECTADFRIGVPFEQNLQTYMIYLGYDQTRKMAFIPNEEIRQELTAAVESEAWNELFMFQQESENLLNETLDMAGDAVAAQIEKIHNLLP